MPTWICVAALDCKLRKNFVIGG